MSCNCHGACNCLTFTQAEAVVTTVHAYLRQPVTQEILTLQASTSKNDLLWVASQILNMNLESWVILIDGQPVCLTLLCY